MLAPSQQKILRCLTAVPWVQVVVHNLPWSCTWQMLKDHFANQNGLERADVIMDGSGRSRCGLLKSWSELKNVCHRCCSAGTAVEHLHCPLLERVASCVVPVDRGMCREWSPALWRVFPSSERSASLSLKAQAKIAIPAHTFPHAFTPAPACGTPPLVCQAHCAQH